MHWRNRESQNDQEYHEQTSFLHLTEFQIFFSFRKWPLYMLLFMLFIHVGKRLSRSSQIFFMTGLLKNFAIFTGKHLYWSLFLIKLQDWRLVFLLKETPTQVFFSMNIARFLKTAFLWNTCTFYFPEILCDDEY